MPDYGPEMTPLGRLPQDSTTGRIAYNDYEFPAARKTQWECKPEYDEVNRIVKYNIYTLRISFFIIGDEGGPSGDTCDAQFTLLRQRLTDPGRRLTVEGYGLGNLSVEAGSGRGYDVAYGPKPQILTFSPLGGNQCYLVSWECIWHVSECMTDSLWQTVPILSAHYDFELSADDQGVQTRSITAKVELIQFHGQTGGETAVTNTSIAEHALRFIKVEVPDNWKRVSQTTHLSADRRFITYRCVDTEVQAEAFPPGISSADINYSLRNSTQMSTEQWTASLAGTIETAPGVPLKKAAEIFFLMLLDKANRSSGKGTAGGTVLISAEVSRRAFTRQSSFSFSWMVTRDLTEILNDSGLWEPVAGANYQQWRYSMEKLWSPEGITGIGLQRQDEVIVGVCKEQQNYYKISKAPTNRSAASVDWLSPFDCGRFNENNSWIAYHNDLAGVAEGEDIKHVLYPTELGTVETGKDDGRGKPGAGVEFDPPGLPPDSLGNEVIEQIDTLGKRVVIMHGKAARVKYQVDVPALKFIGKTKMREVARNVDSGLMAVMYDCPVWYARWSIMYLPEDVVKALGAAENKKAGKDVEGENTKEGA